MKKEEEKKKKGRKYEKKGKEKEKKKEKKGGGKLKGHALIAWIEKGVLRTILFVGHVLSASCLSLHTAASPAQMLTPSFS